MSSAFGDLQGLHGAYTRLTEKFKTLWTFHQFLQGIHKNFLGDASGYQIDFQSLYDQIKSVANVLAVQPAPVVLDQINQLDSRLEAVHRSLATDDARIAPSHVRRFFDRVQTEDEKLILSLLRFYFMARQSSGDTLDKMDFLLTLVSARRSLDDGRYLPRFPQELQRLLGALLGLVKRDPVPAAEAASLVKAIGRLQKDVEACTRFEELSEKKILENLRLIKHRLGPAYYSADVLMAVLEANLAAKNKFQGLFQEEERRIVSSSRQLLEAERELARNPFAPAELQEELRRFHQAKEDFDRKKSEGDVRHREVTRLAESIEQLLTRLEVPDPATLEASQGTSQKRSAEPTRGAEEAPAPVRPAQFEASRKEEVAPPPTPPAGSSSHRTQETPAVSSWSNASLGLVEDPVSGEWAGKILYSVELVDEGTGSGQAASGVALARLRLEPWEVRAARRVHSGELAPEGEARDRDLIFLEAAALRLLMQDEAERLRGKQNHETTPDELAECSRALARAPDLDRRFRRALEAAAPSAPPERLNEINRSRFRLLRTFSGLWLLHNSRVSPT